MAHRAKVFAAEHNTSLSQYVGKLLPEGLEAEQGYRVAMDRWRARKPMVLNDPGAVYPLS